MKITKTNKQQITKRTTKNKQKQTNNYKTNTVQIKQNKNNNKPKKHKNARTKKMQNKTMVQICDVCSSDCFKKINPKYNPMRRHKKPQD